MDILYYLGPFPKISKSFVINEIYELDKMGHNVAVFSLSNTQSEINHDEYLELDLHVEYAEVPRLTNPLENIHRSAFSPSLLKNLNYIAPIKYHAANIIFSSQCIEFLENIDFKPDVIHSHFATILKFGGYYCSRYYDVPFSVTSHAHDIYNNNYRQIFAKADTIVTISDYNKNYIKNNIVGDVPINVIHAGIRPSKFNPSRISDKKQFLTIARFVEKKGIDTMLHALPEIIKHYPDVKYSIVGSGPLEQDYKDIVSMLGISDNVDFLGNISDSELIRELDRAQFFVLPCRIDQSGDRDGIPVALMEAMAMETIPISTSISGIPELIDDGQSGLIVEPNNPTHLQRKIIAALSGNLNYEHLTENAKKKVIDCYNIKKEAKKLESMFVGLNNGHGSVTRTGKL